MATATNERGDNGRAAPRRLDHLRSGLVSGMRRIGLAQPAPPPPPQPGPPGSSQAIDGSELAARRAALAARFAELQWDLGGIAYEMASRDHFRLDVLVARAAELQEVEGSLAEAERLLQARGGRRGRRVPQLRVAVRAWRGLLLALRTWRCPRPSTPASPTRARAARRRSRPTSATA